MAGPGALGGRTNGQNQEEKSADYQSPIADLLLRVLSHFTPKEVTDAHALIQQRSLTEVRLRSKSAIGNRKSEGQPAGEDPREAENRTQTHDLLQGLQLVAGHQHLVTRDEISVVRTLALVDRGNVDGDG